MDVTQVCKMALGMIGQAVISAIDDGTHTANQCKLFYEPTRDAALRDHKWNFALRRIELPQTTPPASGFAHAYQLPSDNLRVWQLNGSDERQWQIEGKTLVTDEVTATIVYTAKVDPDQWDALFTDFFVLLLASKLALSLAHDAAYSADLLRQYAARISDARAVDGQEQGLPDQIITTDLTDDVRNTLFGG